jgi:hypothetical protein
MAVEKQWQFSTIRPKPNTMYQFEKADHRLGYRKRRHLISDLVQYRPYCSCGGWTSLTWYKNRNAATRREFIAHASSSPVYPTLFPYGER